MTCIVGVKTKDGVLLGADSLASSWSAKETRKEPKLHKYSKNIAIGLCGEPRAMQILRYWVEAPPVCSDEFEWAVTEFIPVVRDAFKEHGLARVQHNYESFDSDFILAVNKRILVVWGDFQVSESVFSFDSCGSGSRHAIGAMWATHKLLQPKQVATKGLEAAEEFARGVRRPFHFMEVKSA